MPDSSMKRGATLCLALAIGPGSTLADDSLGHRDNISTGLNQRQKAEMKVPPGFVEGSTLNGFIRNYYFARDNHDTPSRRDQREWAQGLMLSFRSGYTDTPIGIGLDAHAFYGLRLDGGGGSGGAGVLPLDSAGRPADSFSAAGAALKLRGLDSLLKIGDQLLENPVIASGVSRMVPQSYRGVTLKNYHFRALELDAGFVEATRLRNQSGHSHLTSGYGNGTKGGIAADRESPHIAWLGASYSAPGGSQATLYSGRLEDIWNQHYLGLSQPWRLSSQLTLTPWLHYYKTRDQGRSQLGRIDNDLYNAGLTLAGGGPVAEPQPAKGRWRHPVRLHRAERPDLPLRKQRHAVRRLQRPRRALVEDSVPGQPGLPRRPGLAIRRRLRPWPGRPDPGRPGQRGLWLPLQPQWQERPALGTRPVAALRLPRRPGQGPQRDPALGHPPPRRRLHRPRQHPRQLQLRRIPGGGRLPDQVALNPRNQKKRNPLMRAALLPTFGALSAALCLEARADAVALPPLALGNTSFMDGVSRPGMLFELPLQYVRANNASDAGGHSVPGRQRVRGTTLLPHFAYLSQNTLLGAHYGAEVLLPLVRLDLDIDGGPDGRRTRQGDLIVSPLMLQWGPATLFGRPYWQRLNFVFSLPTGDYDKDAAINTGSNTWIFNPHYAFTWELGERLELSGRLHYAWISRNDDPSPRLGANDVQPGQALHANFSISYALDPHWRIGLAGYQLKQISADRIDGHRQADSREQVFGIGPGVMYSQGRQTLFANLYAESGARNRSEGNQLTLRYLLAF